MQLLLHLAHAGQLILPRVVEVDLGARLKVARVLAQAAGSRVAARAHAAVVAQPALVQVRVAQRLVHADPLVRVQRQHLAHEVDGLVCGPLAQAVQRRDVGVLGALGQHVLLGAVAGVLEVLQGRCTQQVGDQVQLTDRAGGLKKN